MDLALLIFAFIGIVIILLTPYIWQGFALTVGSFLVYFMLSETMSLLYFIVLLVGIMVMLLEFFLPSFGAVGIIGIVMILVSLSMTHNNPVNMLFNISAALLIALFVAIILFKMGYRLQLARGLILNDQLTNDKGFQSFQKDYTSYLGTQGMTLTSLRPVGRAKFDEEIVEVLSVGEMIEKHKPIIVYRVEGNKLFVKEIKM